MAGMSQSKILYRFEILIVLAFQSYAYPGFLPNQLKNLGVFVICYVKFLVFIFNVFGLSGLNYS